LTDALRKISALLNTLDLHEDSVLPESVVELLREAKTELEGLHIIGVVDSEERGYSGWKHTINWIDCHLPKGTILYTRRRNGLPLEPKLD
jgi:hypothetical protein